MRPLSAAELLTTWERGLTGTPVDRALLLLASACSPVTLEELERLPVGERDRRLLALREQTFGPHLTSQTSCPRCGEHLEMSFAVADVVAEGGADGDTFTLKSGGYEIELRLPDSRDLRELSSRGEPLEEGRWLLLERCVRSARRKGRKVSAGKLPSQVVRAVAERLAAADPQAAAELALSCPGCAHRWQAPFDIAAFFWTELDAWAKRLLRDVHTLARAYGWNEAEILALTPLRRQCYLEMVQA